MTINGITARLDLGQIVWLKVEPEMKGMITGILLRPGPNISFFVSWNDGEESVHFEMELTKEKPADFENE